MQWALLTWTDGDKAAEGIVRVLHNPIYVQSTPRRTRRARRSRKPDGLSCEVREVSGKGWLKVVRGTAGRGPELRVSLQRVGGRSELVSLTWAPAPPPARRSRPAARIWVGCPSIEQDAIDAVLNLP